MQNKVYNTHQDFKGNHSVLVPVSMYSRNKLLKFMHLKDNKWLGVDLHRYVLTFHPTCETTNFNPKEEIPFSHIKGLRPDLTQADNQKFYLTVMTEGEDFRFKFNNNKDFHAVVDCLRNTLENGRPMFTSEEGYDETVKRLQASRDHHKSGSVSSDDVEEFNSDGEINDYHKDLDKLHEDHAPHLKQDLEKSDRERLKYQYNHNREEIRQEYARQKDHAKKSYDYNIENIDKDVAKSTYEHDIRQAQVLEEARLKGNREVYEAGKAEIKERERKLMEAHHEHNKQALKHAKVSLKEDVHRLKDHLQADYNLYKDGSSVEKDVAKTYAKAHLSSTPHEMKVDLKDANEIRKARY